ncbi:hypothetical protein [Streptoalloteichus hindustanus]|nr:hypothetical protein [Streptoalloteichus hindustanus]
MFTVTMNDAAAEAVRVWAGFDALEPPGGLAPGLRERVARGIHRRGAVLMWADSTVDAGSASSFFPDLTGWECDDSSLHLEDFVPVRVTSVDGQPVVAEHDQRLLLLHGLALAREVGRLAHALQPPTPIRCVISANTTNATFRFHQIRAGERWNVPDLDSYRHDKMIVVDSEPPA